MTGQIAEPTSAEIVEETTEPVATESSTTTTTSELLDSDAFVNKVADAVFDRMKSFTGSLISAQEAAAEVAAQMVPQMSASPAPANEPIPQDVSPQRRHKLFGQPLKRDK